VEGGFTAGLPLVPGGGGGGSAAGQRWGLPVEDEAYKNLCLHASDQVKDILFKPLRFLPGSGVVVEPVKRFVSALIDDLVRSFPGYFCGGAAGGVGSLGGVFKDVVKQGIAKVASSACTQAMKAAPTGSVPGMPGSPLSLSACTAGLTSGFNSVSAGSSITGSEQTSKRLYRSAPMGSEYFASYGFVFSHHLETHDVDAGLSAASWDRVAPRALGGELDRLFQQIQFSKSEAYYDPRRGGPTAGAALTDESMLNMRWRARLRRYRPPSADHRAILGGSGLSSIVRTIRSSAPGMSPSSIVGVVLGSSPDVLSTWSERRVGPTTQRVTGGVLH
jgi:hypothetical protein